LATHENLTELNLDEFSLAALALTLHEVGEDGLAADVLDELGETAVARNDNVYWQGANHDGYYSDKVMASNIRTTALALSAYSQIEPGSELIPGMVRWLM